MFMRKKFRCASVLGLALAGAALVVSPTPTQAKKFPEPSVYPVSWELNFKHGAPKRIVVEVPGAPTPVAYWYMTYTVTNRTDAERTFYPASSFEMVTAEGKVYPGDFAIPDAVFDAVKTKEANSLLEKSIKISGAIRQGEDQARDGVVIWKEPAASLRGFSIYVTNLCGEHVTMTNDEGQPLHDDKGQPVILRKTLELTFEIRGGGPVVSQDQVQAKPERWVMR